MASNSRRTVITGLGVLTSIGKDQKSFWQAMLAGQSGITPLAAFDPASLPIRIAGQIPDFDAKQYVDKKERKNLKVMSRTIQLAVAAAQLALDDGQIDKAQLDPTRFGVNFGAGLIASELEELGPPAALSTDGTPGYVDLDAWGHKGLSSMPPLWMLKYLPNMLACQVSILHNAQGPNNTITENEVAGLLAFGEAYRILQRNQSDFFLVGGADTKLNPLSLTRNSLFASFSRRNEEPTRASRPFDRDRDGMVPGEGAGVLAIEDLDHARKRGATIYAEVVGFGAAFDRSRTGAGLARAMRTALAEAGIGPDQVDHVNAQGFSTIPGDIQEARAIRAVFETLPVPVLAVKSYIGSLGAGCATTETIASVLALADGQLPGTLNYENPDPQCPVQVTRAVRRVTKPCALKLSFTELGQCAALVIRRHEE